MVYDSFHTFDAKDYTKNGCASFLGYASFRNFSSRQGRDHTSFIAKEESTIVGMIEVRNKSHISMLFVSPPYLGKGYGRALVEYAVNDMKRINQELTGVTVNAAPFAHGFYLHLGFQDTEPTINSDGLIYTPMRLLLSDFRSLLREAQNTL